MDDVEGGGGVERGGLGGGVGRDGSGEDLPFQPIIVDGYACGTNTTHDFRHVIVEVHALICIARLVFMQSSNKSASQRVYILQPFHTDAHTFCNARFDKISKCYGIEIEYIDPAFSTISTS